VCVHMCVHECVCVCVCVSVCGCVCVCVCVGVCECMCCLGVCVYFSTREMESEREKKRGDGGECYGISMLRVSVLSVPLSLPLHPSFPHSPTSRSLRCTWRLCHQT